MNYKQITGLIVIIIGVVFVIMAIDAMHQLNMAKNFADDMQEFFTQNPGWNPIITFFGGSPETAPVDYDSRANSFLFTGIGLTILVFAITYFFRTKKKK